MPVLSAMLTASTGGVGNVTSTIRDSRACTIGLGGASIVAIPPSPRKESEPMTTHSASNLKASSTAEATNVRPKGPIRTGSGPFHCPDNDRATVTSKGPIT